MNRLRLNGGMLNGARIVLASAVFACTASASVEATATYIHPAQAAMVATATVAANPYKLIPGASSALSGHATLVATAIQIHTTQWEAGGQATIIAYSLRQVYASAEIGGIAEATFIPASTLAYADVVVTADLSGEATQIQPGRIDAIVTGGLTLAEPTLYRMVEGVMLGGVGFRVESTVNGVQDAYADPEATGGVQIADTGIVIKQVGALIPGVADFVAQPTHIHRANAPIACSAQLVANALLTKPSFANLAGSGALSGNISYWFSARGTPVGVASMTVSARQLHSGAVALGAEGVSLIATAQRTVFGSAQMTGTVGMTARPALQGTSQLPASCEVAASAIVIHAGQAAFLGSGGMSPIGYENLMQPTPPERTFIRPKSLREFVRVSSNRIFTRN